MQYRRAFVPGGSYFFTVVTARRQKLFVDERAVEVLRTRPLVSQALASRVTTKGYLYYPAGAYVGAQGYLTEVYSQERAGFQIEFSSGPHSDPSDWRLSFSLLPSFMLLDTETQKGGTMYSICKLDSIEKYIHPAVVHQTLVKEQSKNVEIWMQTSKPSKPTPTHCHSGEEILIVLKGTGWCQVDGKQVDFGPNSVLTVGPPIRSIKSALQEKRICW